MNKGGSARVNSCDSSFFLHLKPSLEAISAKLVFVNLPNAFHFAAHNESKVKIIVHKFRSSSQSLFIPIKL